MNRDDNQAPLIVFCIASPCRVMRGWVAVDRTRANEHNAYFSKDFDTARSRP